MARGPVVQYVQFHTDGSAARKVKPQAPWKTIKLPKARKQKKIIIRIDPVATIGILLAAFMLIGMVSGIVQLRQVQRDAAVMQQYVEYLQAENEALAASYEAGYDLEEVERMALAIGLVPKAETEQIPITVSVSQETAEPTFWETVYGFLTGLFA